MARRSFRLASISFLTFSLLLGAHQYRLHAHNPNSSVTQTESLHMQNLKSGTETFYQTNPFGMPGADTQFLHSTSLNGHAAAYGITPPTAWKTAPTTLHAQAIQPSKSKTRHWYTYFGLLGLLGLLGLSSRSASSYTK
ncbi:hypothetical protein [Paenibacillus roseipurpureus]|uniref:Uncharacterized protein n=1 Tax=Paenibacillus roseopurpureus TaxID=2918901 RepID=A0AA96LS48_9BACL|nr:hypothetical protein [Paenibacillus sp. MBLB1832]WNR44908.1 hypothetical protein MJB10_01780 [Paenibacillus sp. MBLB1832]